MVDLEQIKIVLQGISTLAALITLRNDSQKEGKEPSDLQIDNAVMPLTIDSSGFEALATTISQDTLSAINEVIVRAKNRYLDALRDPVNNKQARDAEEQIAKSSICGELKRIKRHNGGSLPTDYSSVWDEFGCA